MIVFLLGFTDLNRIIPSIIKFKRDLPEYTVALSSNLSL